MDNFAKEVIASGLCSWFTMRGCRSAEIEDLEKHFKIKLPTVYKEFLLKMGKGASRFMQGTDVFFESLFDNRQAMEEVLELDGLPFSLSSTDFVFSSHQGYIFHFFDTNEDISNPAVYGYKEGDLKTKRISDSFSSFLSASLAEEIITWSKINH